VSIYESALLTIGEKGDGSSNIVGTGEPAHRNTPGKPDPTYEQACCSLLIKQIQFLRPTAILLLGPEVAGRAYQIMPALAPWRDADRWIDIDRSSIGHSARNVGVPAANVRTNVAALLHPSFGAANQGRRMKNMLEPATEAEIIRDALKS